MHGSPTAVAIFSENQAALSGAALPKKKSAAQQLQLQIYTDLKHWEKHLPVCLYCLSILKHLTVTALINKQPTRIGFKAPSKLISRALDLLEKGPEATIDQLQTGPVPLNNYLYRIKRADSPTCQHCDKRETPFNYLITCPTFTEQ
ncbi:hypothetical protein O181_040663 [Austropuccinia psidii MF-1]|uniref:Reverse transcriptase zinc-binding domain-containing protein n=1 Tax=Austropuccinia psidii MF-1 TaxID=1389203 RepID=A0A9Q3HD29_9BASI|nr:hypothetical protein [Austropuccinia psidii MF-1]